MDELGGENDEESFAATKDIKDTCERQLAIWQRYVCLPVQVVCKGPNSTVRDPW